MADVGALLSGRQWGTVREDYSADGNAWASFPFDHANARAYRWGEDGLGGISDRFGFLNFAVALWNGKDPILKERLFGLTNGEGNHGEDAKEYWWAVDGTPTHSWMQWLYRYPQAEYPYQQLRDENAARGRDEREYELGDTGILDGNRFFDVTMSYAKAVARRRLHPDHRHQPRSGGRADRRAADGVVAQHLGLGPRRPAAAPCTRFCRRRSKCRRAGGGRDSPGLPRPLRACPPGSPRGAVLPQRDQRRRSSSAPRRTPRSTPRTASTAGSCTAT